MVASKDKVDTSKFSVLPYLLVFCFPTLIALSLVLKGWWSAIGFFFLYGAVPVFDILLGRDHVNPTKEEAKELDGQIKFRIITWIWVPVQLAMLIGSIHFTNSSDIPLWQKNFFALSVGILGGAVGLNVAHELNHKRNKFEELLAHVLFIAVGYDHFAYEHNLGHHHNVGTPRDPATALLGENFYAFFPRTFFGGIKSSWNIERKLLAKQGKSVWSPSNRIIRGYIVEALVLATFSYFYGIHGARMFLTQCAIAIGMLECVNYIEHYGLMREQYPDGSYEPVDPLHSWNAAEKVTNYLFFKLQRHSDHHTYPYKRYQTLISHEYVAQMPTGYPGMLILSLFPPLWFRIMNPRVLELKRQLQEKKKAEAALGITNTTTKGKAIKGN